MAVKVKETIKGIALEGAYHRIDRIFGGKDENWTAVVSVHSDETKQGALRQYNVSAPFEAGQDPYKAIYKTIKETTNGEDC